MVELVIAGIIAGVVIVPPALLGAIFFVYADRLDRERGS